MKTGGHHTPATIEKNRQAHLGTHHSEETRAKMHEAHLGEKNHFFGKQHTPATREKNRQAHLGTQHTSATKEKNRQMHLRKNLSPETIEKMREAHLGEKNHNFGKHLSPETIEKNRQAHLGTQHTSAAIEKMSGEKNHNWHGGSSFEPYSTAWTEDLKENIRKRDKYSCQLCGRSQEDFSEKLMVHHIDYDKKNLDPENLISLCRSCHGKTNYKRKEWKIVFRTKRKACAG